MHTILSDGTWTPEELLDYLASEQFGLVAITDHDRVDITATLQQLAAARQLPILTAVEMSTVWGGEATDLLCYGFDPEKNELQSLTQDFARRQRGNIEVAWENLRKLGITFPDQHLATLLERPSAQQPKDLMALIEKYGYETGERSAWTLMIDAGFEWATSDPEAVVEAAHRSGAVCLIAQPGRGEGYVRFDPSLLDRFREQMPIDGFEVYHPSHTPEQVAMFREYAMAHGLLTSSGSDSHGPEKSP